MRCMTGAVLVLIACVSADPLYFAPRVAHVCPGQKTQCADGQTCCLQATGEYGCCPLPNAVCCSDKIHCCPEDTKCNVGTGSCIKSGDTVPWLTKMAARPHVSVIPWFTKTDAHPVTSVVCPDGKTECPNGSTCCSLESGAYGCCPLPNAVCCPNHKTCCPKGYTCTDVGCKQGDMMVAMVTMDAGQTIAESQDTAPASNTLCPDEKSECPSSQTCCKLPTGEYGCCPLEHAVCCADHLHCCPQGATCDVTHSRCMQGGDTIPWLTKLPATPRNPKPVKSVTCPGGRYQCPDGETCCALRSGQWGCCPYADAVCCRDYVHCCPQGGTCNLQRKTCDHRRYYGIPWTIRSDLGEMTQATAVNTQEVNTLPHSVICPDGHSECDDNTTCCRLTSGQYGCCPMPKAVCCSDGDHCCPHGYTCDISTGSCNKGDDSVLLTKKKKVPTATLR